MVVVGSVAVGDGDVVCVGVAVAVGADVVGLAVWAGAVVGAVCVAGLDAGCAVVWVGVGVGVAFGVAAGVFGAFVAFPASDAVGFTLGVPPFECETSSTATTAMMTAAAAARMGQRHRRSGDGGPG